MGRDLGVAVFSPFLVLRLLAVSVIVTEGSCLLRRLAVTNNMNFELIVQQSNGIPLKSASHM